MLFESNQASTQRTNSPSKNYIKNRFAAVKIDKNSLQGKDIGSKREKAYPASSLEPKRPQVHTNSVGVNNFSKNKKNVGKFFKDFARSHVGKSSTEKEGQLSKENNSGFYDKKGKNGEFNNLLKSNKQFSKTVSVTLNKQQFADSNNNDKSNIATEKNIEFVDKKKELIEKYPES